MMAELTVKFIFKSIYIYIYRERVSVVTAVKYGTSRWCGIYMYMFVLFAERHLFSICLLWSEKVCYRSSHHSQKNMFYLSSPMTTNHATIVRGGTFIY